MDVSSNALSLGDDGQLLVEAAFRRFGLLTQLFAGAQDPHREHGRADDQQHHHDARVELPAVDDLRHHHRGTGEEHEDGHRHRYGE